jgi:uncharacterized protein (UPF0333 family)
MLGQTAIEYLMLFSIIFIILAILTSYAQDMTEQNRDEISVSNALIAVNKIAEAADIVYTQGSPSQITLSVYIPEGISSIEFSNNMIIMKINVSSGSSDILASSKAPLCCNITDCSIGCISTDSGTKRIKIKAEEGYVNITES